MMLKDSITFLDLNQKRQIRLVCYNLLLYRYHQLRAMQGSLTTNVLSRSNSFFASHHQGNMVVRSFFTRPGF